AHHGRGRQGPRRRRGPHAPDQPAQRREESRMTIKTGPMDFWRFFALREGARLNKDRGDGPPYSKDPILARYHFCNVFRECDAGTRYFQQFRARAKRHESEADLVDRLATTLWQACVYRPVNRVSTFEAFRAEKMRE